jgi:diguanylate cyclase (GGDEF)-like protein
VSHEISDPARIAALRDLEILETPPEPAYDDLAQLASVCCDSPIAAVNFVDGDRHWTKASVGVEDGPGTSVPADISFCAATVSRESGVLSIDDTGADKGWENHPLVAGAPHVGFYAGASITVSGQPVGVVCVYGDQPREVTDREREALVTLARQASAQLELRKLNTNLRDLAIKDPLTGLGNRTLLFDHLALAVSQRRVVGVSVGVLFCDVDDFKSVNDRWGHDAGDQLLCEIAKRLNAAARVGDTVARLAGDEFVVVCPGVKGPVHLASLVNRMESTVLAPMPDPDNPAPPRITIGSALLEDGETASDLIRRADLHMYELKR